MVLSLNDAVNVAQKQTGGLAIRAIFKGEGGSGFEAYGIQSMPFGKLTYTVCTINKDGKLLNATVVDGLTGQVTPEKPIPESALSPNNQAGIKAAQQSPPKLTLQQAAAAAEKEVPGRAIMSSLSSKNGALIYEVDVVERGNAVSELTVDANSGAVMKK